MTVEELRNTSFLKKSEIIAGAKGIKKEIFWCSPDTSIVPATSDERSMPTLLPGALVLYTGGFGKIKSPDYQKYLKDYEISAFCFWGVTDYVDDAGVKEFFNSAQIPFICIKNVSNSISFTRQLSSTINNELNKELTCEEWLKAICYEDKKPDEIIAKHYEYKEDIRYVCLGIVFKSEDTNSYHLEYEMRGLKRMVEANFSLKGVVPLQYIDKNELIAFVPTENNEDKRKLQNRIEKTVREFNSKLGEKRKIKAYSSVCSVDVHKFYESFIKVKKTEALINSLDVHELLSCYENWSMHMLLLREPKEELLDYAKQTLDGICDDPELLETLTLYLTCGESLKNAAELLYIHTNTLKYRLEKISNRLECDLKNPDTRFRLRMAITAYRYVMKHPDKNNPE